MRVLVIGKKSLLLFIFFILLFWSSDFLAQVKISSWNLQNFGKSKSASEISFVANTIKDFDIIALQEVVAGYGGPQAVAKLVDELDRKGSNWDYLISEPTKSSPYSSERYAYIWKTNRVKNLRSAWLENKYESVIEREPFLLDFSFDGKIFTLVNFHAIPKKKQPETEIKFFKFFPKEYEGKNLVFLGDFNAPQSHTVFNPLRRIGYLPVLVEQKTTMKMKCTSTTCLASEYDNIFYNAQVMNLLDSGVIHFYMKFPDMVSARRISDHLPIWAEFDF